MMEFYYMKRRVAVTGLGIISPCGNNIDDFSFNLMAGKSGVRRISSAYSSLLSVKIAAEVDFNPLDYFTKKQVSTMDRVNQFALAAAISSLERFRTVSRCERERAGGSIYRLRYGWGKCHRGFVRSTIQA